MQPEWLFGSKPATRPQDQWLLVGGRPVRPDRSARVTVPRGGSLTEARRFAARNAGWLERQLRQQSLQPTGPETWHPGSLILLRGEQVRLQLEANGEAGLIRFGGEAMTVADAEGDLRPAVERHLRQLAGRELPPRVLELAARHQLPVRRITIRNQRSRWGSCSRRGTISLNWRLVQTPPFVRDYLVLHELAHLREMNHSRRFWDEVARLCPDYGEAERWLRQHAGLLAQA